MLGPLPPDAQELGHDAHDGLSLACARRTLQQGEARRRPAPRRPLQGRRQAGGPRSAKRLCLAPSHAPPARALPVPCVCAVPVPAAVQFHSNYVQQFIGLCGEYVRFIYVAAKDAKNTSSLPSFRSVMLFLEDLCRVGHFSRKARHFRVLFMHTPPPPLTTLLA